MTRSFFCRLALIILLFSSPLALAPQAQKENEPIVHTVQQGENLFRISLRYESSVEAIMAANGLSSPDLVYVGQKLYIPQSNEAAGLVHVGEGELLYDALANDSLLRVALHFGVSTWRLTALNDLSSPYLLDAGQQLLVSKGDVSGDTFVFQRSDTLETVAARFDASVAKLARLNGIVNPALIYVGQVLRLNKAAPVIAPGSGKHIVVDLSEQHLYAYHGDQLVYSFVVSTGASPSVTRTGRFRVQSKLPKAYGSTWDLWMPYWMGIYYAGSTENGFHALPILSNGQTLWAGYLGAPISYGCIVLDTYQARLLYEWATLGTLVDVRH